MNISGIRPYSGFYNYNEIQKTELGNVQAMPQQEAAIPEVESEAGSVSVDSGAIAAKQTFGAYDYANQYNPDTTYELKGVESDIKSLDVEKAISDMQKDQVLHQYQFFVGENTQTADMAATSVRGGEDFSL